MRFVKDVAALTIAPWLLAAAPPAQPLGDALTAQRHALIVTTQGLGGDGAAVIREAVAGARFVAVGEDHMTREIPMFVAALCDLMAPQGLARLVLEVGPAAADALAPALAAPDRERRMAAFNTRYPNAVAFLDTADDNAMAGRCARSGRGRDFRVIGLDQEYVGSAGFLLDRILAERLSPAARAAVQRLRAEESRLAAGAAREGDPSGLLMMSIAPAQLDAAEAALHAGGTPTARAIFGELRASHEIYALNAAGSPDANRVRGLMMKRHLRAAMPARGKLLFKFGDWHLYKGVNPLHQRDLGNFIAETAEGDGARSLHILVLGARGVHATFGGYGKPLGRAPFVMADDRDYRWLGLAVDRLAGGGWTLFDLRPLRHARLDGVDADWRRAIEGYDLMILIPELTPSQLIR